jgi:hypothetical protein
MSLASLCHGDVSHIVQAPRVINDEVTTTTTEGPPNPYSFKYSAGRFPGHIDRVHSETSDGNGRVQGELYAICIIKIYSQLDSLRGHVRSIHRKMPLKEAFSY